MWNIDLEPEFSFANAVITYNEHGVHGHDTVARMLLVSLFRQSLSHGFGAARLYADADLECLRVIAFRVSNKEPLGYLEEEYVPPPLVVAEPAFKMLSELFELSDASSAGELRYQCFGEDRIARARRAEDGFLLWFELAYEEMRLPTIQEVDRWYAETSWIRRRLRYYRIRVQHWLEFRSMARPKWRVLKEIQGQARIGEVGHRCPDEGR